MCPVIKSYPESCPAELEPFPRSALAAADARTRSRAWLCLLSFLYGLNSSQACAGN